MKLSVVATLYRSSEYLDEFCRRTGAAAAQLAGDDFEIILVNDGSPDDSLERALGLSKTNPHLVIVDLSRNFGHYKAIMTGLAQAKGENLFLIDSDLEEEPEWLLPFSQQKVEAGCDVVYGVQKRRKGDFFERWSGQCFYRLFRLMTGLELPNSVTTARLMSRRYVDALLRHGEREVFLAGLWFITGFDQRAHAVVKHATSETTYTLRKKLSIFVNSVTSFSNAPLIAIFYTGVFISFSAAIFTGFLVVRWLGFDRPPAGWTSVVASIWLLQGLVISFLGIIGIYLSKIFSETKQRPYTIIRQIHGKAPPTAAGS